MIHGLGHNDSALRIIPIGLLWWGPQWLKGVTRVLRGRRAASERRRAAPLFNQVGNKVAWCRHSPYSQAVWWLWDKEVCIWWLLFSLWRTNFYIYHYLGRILEEWLLLKDAIFEGNSIFHPVRCPVHLANPCCWHRGTTWLSPHP